MDLKRIGILAVLAAALLFGGSGEVIETIVLQDEMPPTTYTVDLKRCGQLMFWLECGHDSSAPYLIYDIVLRRKK